MKKTTFPIVMLLALCLSACCKDNNGTEDEETLQSTFNNFILKYQQPKLNFDLALYQMYDDDAFGWPFKESDEAITIGQWKDDSKSVRHLNFLRSQDFLVSVLPGASYSYIAYCPNLPYTVIDDEHLLDETPVCHVYTPEDKLPDDFWYAYIKRYEAPSSKKAYEKHTDKTLGNISIYTDTLVFTPGTKPYQIEIIDPSGLMTAVEDIVITGLANGMDLVSGKADDESSEMYIESALPVKAITTVAENGQRTFIGNVAAVKVRTWGRAGKSDVILQFIAVAKEKDFRFNVNITDNIRACPNGGVIDITFPNGAFD